MAKRRCAIFDMDGTLADVRGIRHHIIRPNRDFNSFHAEGVDCPPNDDIVALAKDLSASGVDIIIVTARRSRWRHHTAWFLALNDVPSVAMFMRGDKDLREDVEIKRDILTKIRQTWEPIFAVDDNPNVVGLWIDEGIPTQIVPGWQD